MMREEENGVHVALRIRGGGAFLVELERPLLVGAQESGLAGGGLVRRGGGAADREGEEEAQRSNCRDLGEEHDETPG